MITAQLNMAPLLHKLRALGLAPRQPMQQLVKEQARLFVSSSGGVPGMIQLTPPAGNGIKGNAAKQRGEMAIFRDLLGGKHGGGSFAGIFVVMDDALLAANAKINSTGVVRLFAKKDGTVYGCDQHFYRPQASVEEMRAHHLQYFRNGRMTQAGGRTRDIGRWKFLDQMVVTRSAMLRYLRYINKHVGIYASGFNAAAQQLGAKGVPAWVTHHGTAYSGISVRQTDTSFFIVLTDRVPFGQADTTRRMHDVLRYRDNALARAMPHIIRRMVRVAGFASVTT
jgi:hypothetical protein